MSGRTKVNISANVVAPIHHIIPAKPRKNYLFTTAISMAILAVIIAGGLSVINLDQNTQKNNSKVLAAETTFNPIMDFLTSLFGPISGFFTSTYNNAQSTITGFVSQSIRVPQLASQTPTPSITNITNNNIYNSQPVAISPRSLTGAMIGLKTVQNENLADRQITVDKLANTLTFTASNLLDLSAINHSSSSNQGLLLPNVSSASPSTPTSGKGYIAFDTADNKLVVYTSSGWQTVGSASSSSNTINSLSGNITIAGAGINTVTSSGSTITITGTDTDTLASVTGRGATTTTALSLGDVTLGASNALVVGSYTADPISPSNGTIWYNSTTGKWKIREGATTKILCNTTDAGCGASGGSTAWSALLDPTGNLALAMGANTTTFTYNGTTGVNNLFKLIDTTSNTGTGYIFDAETAALSNAKPLKIAARGTTIIDTTATGALTLGSGTTTLALTTSTWGINSSGTATSLAISGATNTLSSIANASLTNSSVTINSSGILTGGGAMSLGGSLTLTATEADTLTSVTGRGASTATGVTLSAASPLTLSNAAPILTLATLGVNGTLTIKDAEAVPNTLLTLTDSGTSGTLTVNTLAATNIGAFTATGNITGSGAPTISGFGTINGTTLSGGTLSGTALSGTGSFTITGGVNASETLTLISTANATKGNIQFFSSANTIDSSGNITAAGNIAANGGSITTTQTTANLFNANATTLNIGGAATTLNLTGTGSAAFNFGNATGITALNLTSGTGSQTFTSSVATGTNTTGAFVFKDAALTTGDMIYATASAITTGNILKLGQGGDSAFSGNAILADLDNTGGGGGTFTGNFLKFNNAGSTKFTVNSAGTASISGTVANVAIFIDGNGNISTTNRNNLTLGNSGTYNSTGNILLNPNATGNVGIGTTTPITALDVSGNVHLTNSIVSQGPAAYFSFGYNTYYNGSNWVNVNAAEGGKFFRGDSGSIILYSGTSGAISTVSILGGWNGSTFFNQSGATIGYGNGTSAPSNGLAIAGNVGIGTTTPTSLLDVNGNASVSGTLAFHTGTGTIQTTTFSPLIIGGNTTGNITLNPSNSIAGGFVAPNTTNVTDLGTASLLWRNIYGTTIAGTSVTQNGNSVCDNSGNCLGVASYFQLTNKILSPANSTYDLTIGGAATGSAFQVFGIEKATGDIAKLSSTVITSGNVFEATASAITTGNIIKLGQGGDGAFSGNGITMDFDNTGGGGGTFTGKFLNLLNATVAKMTVDASGNVANAGYYGAITGSNLKLRASGSGIGQTGTGSIYFQDSTGTTRGRVDTTKTALNTGTGATGALSVATTVTINDNSGVNYGLQALSASAASNQTTIPIASTANFAAGDEVLVIQMQGNGAGSYEFRTVSSVNANTSVVVSENLTHNYTEDATSSAQLVEVPQFTNVTITAGKLTAPAWNGSTGGILVFRATGTVSCGLASCINMTGLGFRGGASTEAGTAFTGEGINMASLTTNATATNYNAGGGGGRGVGGGGGAGGAGYTTSSSGTAGAGGTNGSSGKATEPLNMSRLYMGAGAGGGGDDSGTAGIDGGAGGAGGGIILFTADQIQIASAGSISNDGNAGGTGTGTNSGGGGGGGGGPAFVQANRVSILNTSTTKVIGGSGGTAGAKTGTGGAGGTGGVGATRLDAYEITGINIDSSSSIATIVNSLNKSYGTFNIGAVDTQAADVAEMYQSENDLEPGDIVTTSGNITDPKINPQFAISYATQKGSPIMGAISTKPGMVLGSLDIPDSYREFPVALNGRTPVNVISANGPIHKGDQISISAVRGIGQKALGSGYVVGYALEDFVPGVSASNICPSQIKDADGNTAVCGSVMTFIQPGWFDATSQIVKAVNDNNNQITFGLNTNGEVTDSTISAVATSSAEFTLPDWLGKLADPVRAMQKAIVANIESGSIKAKSVTTDSLNVTNNNYVNRDLFKANEASISAQIDAIKSRIDTLETQIPFPATAAASISTSSASLMQTLNVLGNSLLSDTFVNGKLSIGIITVDNQNGSIDAIGKLKLQPLALGSIEFQNNSIEIDTKGNLNIKKGVIMGNSSIRDAVEVPFGQTTIKVVKTWDSAPATVILTPSYQTTVWATDVTDKGFTINVSNTTSNTQKIYWQAMW